jgi:hypothetical protein
VPVGAPPREDDLVTPGGEGRRVRGPLDEVDDVRGADDVMRGLGVGSLREHRGVAQGDQRINDR